MKRITLFLFTILFISSCTTYQKVQLTECNHESGHCKEIRDLANKSWKYVVLSNNVYKKNVIPLSQHLDYLETFENSKLDFYSELYIDKDNNEYVIAFRGTDSKKDFITGNLSQKQNKYALSVYDSIITKYNINKIITTGHSLGGAISTYISLNRSNVTSYTFNSSPVFKKGKETHHNERYSIVEKGEVLKIFRVFGREATQLYTSLNCSKGNPIKKHGIYNQAICLLNIASHEDKNARKLLSN